MNNIFFKSIYNLLTSIISVLFLIFFMTIGVPLLILLTVLVYTIGNMILFHNRIYFRKSLKPIINEAKDFYNINIVNHEYLYFYKDDKFTQIPIPAKVRNLKKVSNLFKNNVGSIDCDDFIKNRNNLNAISMLKSQKKNIFFSPLYNDTEFLKSIHLYDLSSLDTYELQSILSMDLTSCQKAIIYNKYLSAHKKEWDLC